MKKPSYKRIQLLVSLLLLLIASSCGSLIMQESPTQTAILDARSVDDSLFTGIPCKAPCWYGLELGKSTEADALTTLSELSFIDPDTIEHWTASYWDPKKQNNITAKLITAKCEKPKGQQCVGLVVADDNLKSIDLFPNRVITIQEVVDHLGAPDYVQLLPSFTPSCSLGFIWIDKQTILSHTGPNSDVLCEEIRAGTRINPNLTIHSVSYVLSDDISLTTIPEVGRDFSWPGFVAP